MVSRGVFFLAIKSRHLCRLDGSLKLRAKDLIPELAGDAEAEFIVEEVVCEMILLQLLVPQR